MGMGIPSQWHRRQAIVLAGQLPDTTADALLVLQALNELVDTFLVANESEGLQDGLGMNILPFGKV